MAKHWLTTPGDPMLDDLRALRREMCDEFRALRREIAALRAAVAPEFAWKHSLLAAIHAELGTSVFTAADLVGAAAANPDGALAAALPAAMGDPPGQVRRLGGRLGRLVNDRVGDLVLRRSTKTSDGMLYAVVVLDDK